jgi:hypothetical protein
MAEKGRSRPNAGTCLAIQEAVNVLLLGTGKALWANKDLIHHRLKG